MEEAWESLDPIWKEAFFLAWESFQAGSVAVGAVVLDPSGHIVSRGRSRAYEQAAPAGVLAGTYLAHAEVNALAALRPGDYWDHLLLTTLEPCLLCTAATTHVHVGQVRYAAPDPVWAGIERLPELNEHVARRFHARQRVDLGPLSLWAGALPKASRAIRLQAEAGTDPDTAVLRDPVLAATEAAEPDQIVLARAIIASGVKPGDGTDLETALRFIGRTFGDLGGMGRSDP